MKIVYFCLIISCLGIFILFLIQTQIKPKEINSEQELKLGDFVRVTGTILSVRDFSGFQIIKLNNNVTLTCDNCNFSKGEKVKARGRVTEYKTDLQVEVQKIEIEK